MSIQSEWKKKEIMQLQLSGLMGIVVVFIHIEDYSLMRFRKYET